MSTNKWKTDAKALDERFKKYMGSCDGKSIDRIIEACGLKKEER